MKKIIWVLTYLGDGGYEWDYFPQWKFFSSFKKLKKYIWHYVYGEEHLWHEKGGYGYYNFNDSISERKDCKKFIDFLGEGHKTTHTYAWHIMELDEMDEEGGGIIK